MLAATVDARTLRWLTVALVMAMLVVVWSLAVLPCQDLPQHLAYAKILRDYSDPQLRLAEVYQLAQRFHPYSSLYWVLAVSGRWLGILGALRVVLTFYVLSLFAAFHFLVVSVHGQEAPGVPWTRLLAVLLVWNPTLCMGFLQFALCIPLILIGCAFVIRATEPRGGRLDIAGAIATLVVLGSLHVVAAGFLVLWMLLHSVMNPSRQRWIAWLGALAVLTVVGALWGAGEEIGAAKLSRLDFAGAMRESSGLEFIDKVFRITWYDPIVTLNYVLWTLFGPYRLKGQLLVASAIATCIVLCWRFAATPAPPTGERACRFRRTTTAFTVVSLLLPWGFYVPTELTFLNFRGITVAFGLLLAAIPPTSVRSKMARAAVAGLAAVIAGHFAFRAFVFANEVKPIFSLLQRAQPRGVLLSLSCHNKSSQFARQFRVTHFLPMYYTVLDGGINTQFWANYVEHLPIGYRHQAPAQPNDWAPETFRREHLSDSDYLIVEAADPDDSLSLQNGFRAAQAIIRDAHLEADACAGRWCLYRLKKGLN
jgi:hypothetical protein